MEKFLQVLGRLIKVLRFLITIPLLCFAIVGRVFETQKDNYWYYYSENKVEESAYILREGLFNEYCNIEENLKICNDIKNESAKEFTDRFLDDPNSDLYKDLNNFFNGNISSKKFMDKETNLYSWKYDLKYSKKSVLFWIFYSILLIIWYIILTDLLAKIWWYIWNWKFSWWIDYKKLFKLK